MSAQLNTWDSALQAIEPCSVDEAFAYCERMAHSHYENFPVGSLLVPKSRRRHIYSIYAFARTGDDFADEGYEDGEDGLDEAEHLAALDDWESKLEASYRGEANHPVFVALAETVREFRLPIQPFRDMLSAFKDVYRFCRTVDDIVDDVVEGSSNGRARPGAQAELEKWRAELNNIYSSQSRSPFRASWSACLNGSRCQWGISKR
jgi:phytoene/squalene synthetase